MKDDNAHNRITASWIKWGSETRTLCNLNNINKDKKFCYATRNLEQYTTN